MKIYYKKQFVIATHSDNNAPDPSVYGLDVKVMTVPDGTVLEREGPLVPGSPTDMRPYKLPVIPVEEAKVQAKATVVEMLNTFSNKYLLNYPQSEMLSWSTKDAAARSYLKGETLSESQLLLLNAEKNAGNYPDLDTLCNVIVANSDNFSSISGSVAGIRVTASAEIDKCKTTTDIDRVIEGVADKLSNIASRV